MYIQMHIKHLSNGSTEVHYTIAREVKRFWRTRVEQHYIRRPVFDPGFFDRYEKEVVKFSLLANAQARLRLIKKGRVPFVLLETEAKTITPEAS